MGLALIEYNGYTFNDRSHYHVSEQYRYDDSERTVKSTMFRLNVRTIITGDSQAVDYVGGTEFASGTNVHTARQLLSKPGGRLSIRHDGLGPHWEINGYTLKDISWGPKPRILRWDPIGHTNTAEVEWECDFEIAVCDGGVPPALTGVVQFNYSVSFSIDSKGYTTRRITGSLEIPITRVTQMSTNLPTSVDLWKEQITFSKPNNFERHTDWSISMDKRSATFVIIDTEIQSPNAWPPGVVSIQATHRVTRTRAALSRVANSISATIELCPTEPKARTWMIFRDLFLQRIAWVSGNTHVFIDVIEIAEEIYANKASFQIQYHYLDALATIDLFSQTGLFQPLQQGGDPWQLWAQSLRHLTPHAGTGGDRAAALMEHEFYNERIIDLCHQDRFGFTPPRSPGSFPPNPVSGPPTPPPYTEGSVLSNRKPPTRYSWLVFNTTIEVVDQPNVSTTVALGPNDTNHENFNPQRPDVGLPGTQDRVKRFIEDQAGIQNIVVRGYAERVGYPVPKPSGRIFIGGTAYTPVGKGTFAMKFDGMYFGVPKYSAAWEQEYRLLTWPDNNTRPEDPLEGIPVEDIPW